MRANQYSPPFGSRADLAGFFFAVIESSNRVAVLIDWQNVYRLARRAFRLDRSPPARGVVDPVQLARIVTKAHSERSELKQIEIFRGLPDRTHDARGHRANVAQGAAWLQSAREARVELNVHARPLQYRLIDGERRPFEKGVDVQLAISAVVHAMSDDIDTVVIFSHDSDLLPAVEAIAQLRGPEHVETASWRSQTFRSRLRPVPGVFHHHLGPGDFARVETPVDFARRK